MNEMTKEVKFIVTVTTICAGKIVTESTCYDGEAIFVTSNMINYCRSFGPIDPIKQIMKNALDHIARSIFG